MDPLTVKIYHSTGRRLAVAQDLDAPPGVATVRLRLDAVMPFAAVGDLSRLVGMKTGVEAEAESDTLGHVHLRYLSRRMLSTAQAKDIPDGMLAVRLVFDGAVSDDGLALLAPMVASKHPVCVTVSSRQYSLDDADHASSAATESLGPRLVKEVGKQVMEHLDEAARDLGAEGVGVDDEGECDKRSTVTVRSGGRSITLTGEQLHQAAQNAGEALRRKRGRPPKPRTPSGEPVDIGTGEIGGEGVGA